MPQINQYYQLINELIINQLFCSSLRPEILARQLRQQGSYPPQMRHFPPPHRTAPNHYQQQYQQQLQQYQQQQQQQQHQLDHFQPQLQQQHQQHFNQQQQQQNLQGTLLQHHLHHQQQQQQLQLQQQQQQQAGLLPPQDGEGGGRQPLYANAPPKPKRLNNSRDYSPSPNNSPERPNESRGADDSTYGVGGRTDDPAAGGYPRHRLPQERRTPEAYGRSRFAQQQQLQQLQQLQQGDQQLEYEDVYSANHNEEIKR